MDGGAQRVPLVPVADPLEVPDELPLVLVPVRASLYKPLLALAQDERARVVDLVVRLLLAEGGE